MFKFLLFLLVVFTCQTGFAADPSASQQMSGQVRARELQEEDKNLKQQIEQPVTKISEISAQEQIPEEKVTQKVFIRSIRVSGVTVFPESQINAIILPYENKELTFREIQKIADQITTLYRKKGFVLSRAYIPEQKMADGVLEIKVLEATIGNIELKGNRYYSTKLLKNYLTIKEKDQFNYNDLKRDLNIINKRPDRMMQSVLVAGQQPGTTDIVLNTQDSLPIHVSFGYNNFLSSFLGHSIYETVFTHNNLLGQDDILRFQYERGEANDYYSYNARYIYPVTKTLDMGIYTSHSKQVLGGQFADLGARGKSRMYGIFGTQRLLTNDNFITDLNYGFDHKDVYNYLNGNISSQDKLRIVNIGFNVDISDNFGRTIINDEFNYGILGDTPASRAGAGGEFFKNTLNLIRLQKLIFGSTLLWKNQLQFSRSTLTSTEQFQVGGPNNNRGYPSAELVGDQGYSMSWELGHQLYSTRSWKISLFEFYDWSNVHLNSLQPGDKKNNILRSAGFGTRLNVLKNLSANYTIGWPLDHRPSDNKNIHHWIELTLTF